MENDFLVKRFPKQKPDIKVVSGKGSYLFAEDGKKYFDMTSGYSGCVAVGYSNKKVLDAISKQYENIQYLSANDFDFEHASQVAELITRNLRPNLDKVWFNGGGGSEAIEGALKLSFLDHQANGNRNKKWFIARKESYHGITLFANSLTDIL